MRGTYQQLAQFIRTHSDLSVTSAPYPASARKVAIASLCFYLQIIALVLIFFSATIFPFLGLAEPEAFKEKLYPMMIVWFVGYMLQNMMTQTGAFEIYKGNTLIWSTLHYRRMPAIEDILSGFAAVGVQFRQ